MSEIVLKVENLNKSYGNVHALKGLSFEVTAGSVYGFLGPNGSGKTTTMAILLGILSADSGQFSWFGNGQDDANRMRLGALLETPNFYPYLSARQNLKVTGLIKNVDNLETRINEVIERVGLVGRDTDKFKTYSLGMKQRLAIASALLNDPEILVLDEPTNGLDPQGIADIRELISSIANDGKTIIIASHILDEIEKVCTHVAIMQNGQLLSTGTLGEILGGQTNVTVASEDLNALSNAIGELSWAKVSRNTGKELIVEIEKDHSTTMLNKALFEKGVILNTLKTDQKNLESIFLETIQS